MPIQARSRTSWFRIETKRSDCELISLRCTARRPSSYKHDLRIRNVRTRSSIDRFVRAQSREPDSASIRTRTASTPRDSYARWLMRKEGRRRGGEHSRVFHAAFSARLRSTSDLSHTSSLARGSRDTAGCRLRYRRFYTAPCDKPRVTTASLISSFSSASSRQSTLRANDNYVHDVEIHTIDGVYKFSPDSSEFEATKGGNGILSLGIM